MENLVDKKGFCFVCGNKGLEGKECPSCGRAPKDSSLNFEFREDVTPFVKKIDAFGIPDTYRGVIWSADVLMHDKPEFEDNYNFKHFVEMLQKINGLFEQGVLSPKSAIIIAPAGFSKMIFAYSCMQRALDYGFSVAPLLDTVELKRLIYLSSENPNYRMYGSINYDKYVMSDVCFVTVTKAQQRSWAYEIIQEIIDKRARKGLSTFVISRFDLSEITAQDKSNSFEAITSADIVDVYKYPAIIKFKNT